MTLEVGLMLATVANTDTGRVDTRRVLDAAQRAEAAGFDGVYVGDHMLHPHPILESIVTLSAVAASTERVSLGPCVLLAALRQPLVLAKQLGTLAAFAPGRLRVGVGVGGEYPGELEAAGVPLRQRGRSMEQALSEVQSLLAAGPDRDDLAFQPAAPLPFLLGGWKEVALRRAGTYGDGWIGYLLTPDSFAKRRDFLLECAGGKPFTTGMLLPVHVDATDRGRATAQAAVAWTLLTGAASGIPERFFLAGSADDVVEHVMRYVHAGCTEVILGPADQGNGYLDQVSLLVDDVLPRLRKAVRCFSTGQASG